MRSDVRWPGTIRQLLRNQLCDAHTEGGRKCFFLEVKHPITTLFFLCISEQMWREMLSITLQSTVSSSHYVFNWIMHCSYSGETIHSSIATRKVPCISLRREHSCKSLREEHSYCSVIGRQAWLFSQAPTWDRAAARHAMCLLKTLPGCSQIDLEACLQIAAVSCFLISMD